MKAKCPFCKNGCQKCKDGYFEVSFPENIQKWDKVCQDCNAIVGGCFSETEPIINKNAICPNCYSKNLKPVKVQ